MHAPGRLRASLCAAEAYIFNGIVIGVLCERSVSYPEVNLGLALSRRNRNIVKSARPSESASHAGVRLLAGTARNSAGMNSAIIRGCPHYKDKSPR